MPSSFGIEISQVVDSMLLTKTTAAQIEAALCHHIMRGLYFLAVIFSATIEF